MKVFVRLALLTFALAFGFERAAAQGTAFTYQGQLSSGGAGASGFYDFQLLVYDASTGGTLLAGPVTRTAVSVNNGLFTMQLDFGPGLFTGGNVWLQIGVRTNGAGAFTSLSPRQQLAPAPYAIFAEGANAAGVTGTLPTSGLSGIYGNPLTFNNPGNTFTGNGAGLLNVNAGLLGGLAASNFWQTTGNAGTAPGVNFLGTTDNQPLEFNAFGLRGLHLERTGRSSGFPFLFTQAGMNVIGGYWGNTISNNVIGGTIAGGGDETGPILFRPYPNTVSDDFGAVGGGYANTAGYAGAIPGGYQNIATGAGSFAAGRYAHTTNPGSFIWGDGSQTFNSTGPNAFDVLASGGAYFYTGPLGVNIDYLNLNTNTINYGLRFGVGSGEGIGSNRSPTANQYGLDFYTAFANRMTIQNDGSTRFYDNNLYLRGGTDPNHGIGYRSTVYGRFFDGPFVWGYNGGGLGTAGPDEVSLTWDYQGNVWISNNCSVATLSIRGGADLAEPFEITGGKEQIREGAVVVIDEQHPGHLAVSAEPYDTRVAGVVSGANGITPGIQMQQQGLLEGGRNVALSGRVYVQADASFGAIKPGDLLTTSSTPGHAMKVGDHARAQGAVLGKAMTGLNEGRGSVLVLVTLQ